MGKNSTFRRIQAAALLVLVLGALTWVNYSTLATRGSGMTGKDFMSLWTGGKAIALGLNPYDVKVWCPLRADYGSTWMPDPISPWPLWTHLIFVPFSFLTPQAAGALWMTVCELSLILGILLIVRTSGWESWPAIFVLSLGTFMFPPALLTLTNGQVAAILFLLLAASYALYERGRPFAAGFLLALEVLKPNLTAILLVTVGLMFLVHRDWRALAGLVTGGLTLLAITWVILPGWLFEWLSIAGKAKVARINPTIWGLAYQWGGELLWPGSAVWASVVLYLGLLLFLWKQRKQDWLFSLGLATIAATFLAPYLWHYEQTVLLFPTIVALHWGLTSKRGPRWAWWAGWWFVTVVLSWMLVISASRGSGIDPWSAFVPLASLGFFLLAWRAWNTGRQSTTTVNERPGGIA